MFCGNHSESPGLRLVARTPEQDRTRLRPTTPSGEMKASFLEKVTRSPPLASLPALGDGGFCWLAPPSPLPFSSPPSPASFGRVIVAARRAYGQAGLPAGAPDVNWVPWIKGALKGLASLSGFGTCSPSAEAGLLNDGS